MSLRQCLIVPLLRCTGDILNIKYVRYIKYVHEVATTRQSGDSRSLLPARATTVRPYAIRLQVRQQLIQLTIRQAAASQEQLSVPAS